MLPLLILAAAPGFFVLWYFYYRDRFEPEPLRMIIKVFFFGCIAVIPAILLELPFPEGFWSVVVAAPLVEESIKFCVVFFTVFRDQEFDEPMDGIVYAVAAALGFATIENIFYVLGSGFETGIVRAFLSVPGHALFACFWGYSLGVAKFRPRSEWPVLLGGGLLGGILLHAAFNGLLFFGDVAGIVLVACIVTPFGWWMAHRAMIRASSDPHSHSRSPPPSGLPHDGPPVCDGCGAPISPDARFCRRCGAVSGHFGALPGSGGSEKNVMVGHSCPVCHEGIAEHDRFCTNCGFPLPGMERK